MAVLTNNGNTCFMNSTLQCLSVVEELDSIFEKMKEKDSAENILSREYFDLRKLMKKHQMISPQRFVNAVKYVANKKQRDLFTGHVQNDLPEFLMFMVECFHTALAREINIEFNSTTNDKMTETCYKMFKETYSKEFSEIIQLFFGIHVSTIYSGDVVRSMKPEPFFILDLSIGPDTETLYDCLNLYCGNETLENENAWYNEETNTKENVHKNIRIWSWPTVLVIDLKRVNNNNTKNNRNVQIPLELNLNPYSIKEKDYTFDLVAVCNHTGNSYGGHYTAQVKRGGRWILYNDDQCSDEPLNTSNAYCLFYNKR